MATIDPVQLPSEWTEDPETIWVLHHPDAGDVPFSHAKPSPEAGSWTWEDSERVHTSSGQPESDGNGGWTWVDGDRRFTVRAVKPYDYGTVLPEPAAPAPTA